VSRRPTVLHSCFMSFVVQEIAKRLDDIAKNGDLASSTFAQKIRGMGSARIDLLGSEDQEGKPKMRRNPDFSFQHQEARWAGVVLELSHPMKRRAVPHLADDYLLETYGDIRILVGIDLDTDTKRGCISTWQPLFKRNDQGVIIELEAALVRDGEVFRDKYGNANPDPESGLRLDLEDFGPTDLTVDLISKVPVFIDSATLCLCLARAEAFQLNRDEARDGVPYQPRPLKIRKRRREEMESSSEASGDEVMECDDVAAGDTATEKQGVASTDEEIDSAVASRNTSIDEEKVVSRDEEMPSRIPPLLEEGSENDA
jgi:hypothetical protein